MTATNDSDELEALFDAIAGEQSKPTAVQPNAEAGDSDDLQALFDSVSQQQGASAPPPSVASGPATADSPDLEALFDSVVAQQSATVASVNGGEAVVNATPEGAKVPATAAGADAWSQQEVVFNQVGQMARLLHDAVSQLGYDKLLEKTMSALPDAQDRLAYVANLTEQAACKVLNATDVAGPLVDEIENGARELAGRWDRVFANQVSTAEFKALAGETRSYLKETVPVRTRATHAQLTEIMMAQDFQDLTGQVIKKIVNLAQELESGLMKVLLETLPDTKRTEEVESLMNGPVVNAEGRTDVVVNQAQVDDLLDSLGF